ncbi:hypothetical protein PG989_007114 [Apiospora arundinis]
MDILFGNRETTLTVEPPRTRLAFRGNTLSSILERLRDPGERPAIWSEPEQSTGRLLCKSGRNSIWEACGPARDAFSKMAPDIKDYLEGYVEPISSWVTWSMYMIGSVKNRASPTVLFCCEVVAHRREVRDAIRQSGILDGYPGVKTGHMAKPPGFEELVPLARDSSSERLAFSLSVDIRQRRLTIREDFSADAKSPTTATLGGIIKIRDKFLFTTAGHPFFRSPDPDALTADSDSQSVETHDALSLDGDSETDADDDDEIEGLDLIAIKSKGYNVGASPSTTTKPSSKQRAPRPSSIADARGGTSLDQVGDLFVAGMSGSGTGLDYALVEVENHGSIARNTFKNPRDPRSFVTVNSLAEDTTGSPNRLAIIVTSQNTLSGAMSETPSYARAPRDAQFRKMLRVFVDGRLEKGDCGSWVIDADTGDLYGHVVAGSLGSSAALVLPFSDVFRDILHRVKVMPEFPASDAAAGTNTDKQALEDKPGNAHEDYFPSHSTSLNNVGQTATAESPPVYTTQATPLRPDQRRAIRFLYRLISISQCPTSWENARLLYTALQLVPFHRIHHEAEQEAATFWAQARLVSGDSALPKPDWGYQDCLVRALLRWFKQDFFSWVNNPVCTTCQGHTVSRGISQPTAQENAFGASRVELYQCSSPTCKSYERFPRFSDPGKLLVTRRGRVGEWANCFGLLCRATGSRVRWVWNMEDYVWVEVYSEHRQRWVHVDACEEAWDNPMLYAETWGKRMSYCIAFSTDGAADVTRRYVRLPEHHLDRSRCSEMVLAGILNEIKQVRRLGFDKQRRFDLEHEDALEEEELQSYALVSIVKDLGSLLSQRLLNAPRGSQSKHLDDSPTGAFDIKHRQSALSQEHTRTAGFDI